MKNVTEETNEILLNIVLEKAEYDILNFCHIPEIPPHLNGALEDLAIYKLSSIGNENLTSEKRSSYVTSFKNDIPKPLKDILILSRRMRIPS